MNGSFNWFINDDLYCSVKRFRKLVGKNHYNMLQIDEFIKDTKFIKEYHEKYNAPIESFDRQLEEIDFCVNKEYKKGSKARVLIASIDEWSKGFEYKFDEVSDFITENGEYKDAYVVENKFEQIKSLIGSNKRNKRAINAFIEDENFIQEYDETYTKPIEEFEKQLKGIRFSVYTILEDSKELTLITSIYNKYEKEIKNGFEKVSQSIEENESYKKFEANIRKSFKIKLLIFKNQSNMKMLNNVIKDEKFLQMYDEKFNKPIENFDRQLGNQRLDSYYYKKDPQLTILVTKLYEEFENEIKDAFKKVSELIEEMQSKVV